MVVQRNDRTAFIIGIFTRHCWQLRNSIIDPYLGPLFSDCKEAETMNVLIILVGILAISVLLIGGTQGMYLFLVVIRLSSEVADTGIVGHRIFIDCCGYLIFYQRL